MLSNTIATHRAEHSRRLHIQGVHMQGVEKCPDKPICICICMIVYIHCICMQKYPDKPAMLLLSGLLALNLLFLQQLYELSHPLHMYTFACMRVYCQLRVSLYVRTRVRVCAHPAGHIHIVCVCVCVCVCV